MDLYLGTVQKFDVHWLDNVDGAFHDQSLYLFSSEDFVLRSIPALSNNRSVADTIRDWKMVVFDSVPQSSIVYLSDKSATFNPLNQRRYFFTWE